jgi:hypothetical protein
MKRVGVYQAVIALPHIGEPERNGLNLIQSIGSECQKINPAQRVQQSPGIEDRDRNIRLDAAAQPGGIALFPESAEVPESDPQVLPTGRIGSDVRITADQGEMTMLVSCPFR